MLNYYDSKVKCGPLAAGSLVCTLKTIKNLNQTKLETFFLVDFV